jgi:formate dehydrogenase major subunit
MGGGTSSYQEVEETDLIILWGSNARETHPIFFHHVLQAVRKGARLVVVDPRRTSSAQWADTWLGLDVGSDIAVANGVAREIIASGLHHQEFIDNATSGFEAYSFASNATPRVRRRVSGVPADAIRKWPRATRVPAGFRPCVLDLGDYGTPQRGRQRSGSDQFWRC